MLNNTDLTIQFPYAHFHAEWNLVTWHPTGILDNDRADHLCDFLELQEAGESAPFHRFVDMTGYSRIHIELEHVVHIALRRKRAYHGPPVKSAIYAVRLISVGVARMYQEILEGTPIKVATFRDRAAAADWLEMPESILAAPNAY